MPTKSKMEVSSINLRIPSGRSRKYCALINRLFKLRTPINVRGDSFIAITNFDEKSGDGVFSKFTKIDIKGDWFDVANFTQADSSMVHEISIPEPLRPNLSAFRFSVSEKLHVVSFESYFKSKTLNPRSVEKYFREILRLEKVVREFGHVEVNVIKDFNKVSQILELPKLTELHISISRPNPDDVSRDLARRFEERLTQQNANAYNESLISREKSGLAPDDQTRRFAMVAAENGEVLGKSKATGSLVSHTTSLSPQKVVELYDPGVRSSRSMFRYLTSKAWALVKDNREKF